jgi:cyclophilin family peptidyl-prolyl cis-trans isomerase
MFKKTMKKIACAALATVSVVGCVGMFTACETNNPEVKMTIEFQDETYTLEYKLYRKIAPSTVKHFLWLAENGYYDGLAIHDYDATNNKLFGGAYTAEGTSLTYKEYYDVIKTFDNYANFPHSVWGQKDKTSPTYTLYGEFENNKFQVTSGALKENFGTLTMYYTTKNTTDRVYVKRAADGEISPKDYKYNCATSMFYISTRTSAKADKSYCTFATLNNKGELEELLDDIALCIEENYNDDVAEFVSAKQMYVDADDAYVSSQNKSVSYDVPKEAIVIKSVKVTKY